VQVRKKIRSHHEAHEGHEGWDFCSRGSVLFVHYGLNISLYAQMLSLSTVLNVHDSAHDFLSSVILRNLATKNLFSSRDWINVERPMFHGV
jgi:hypothetical protein